MVDEENIVKFSGALLFQYSGMVDVRICLFSDVSLVYLL